MTPRKRTRVRKKTQWQVVGDNTYTLLHATADEVEPGLFTMVSNNTGFYFVRNGDFDERLIPFPGTPISEVVDEIEKFWDRAEHYKRYGLSHRRGILLYGPPGSGKSCCLKLVAKDVIERGGVVFPFRSAGLFSTGYGYFRSVQPETPIVVLMEDLEAIIKNDSESAVLNLLDGAEPMHKVVFLATTNYPELLKERIKNRPSRFDRRFEIKHPNDEARRLYLESLLPEDETLPDIERYVRETRGMSLAHLKELFISTAVMGNDFDKVIRELKRMADSVHSADGAAVDTGYA